MWSFGRNETTSNPPKYLHVLYKLGVLIGYSACKFAVVSRCLMGEIAVMAPHQAMIVFLRNGAHILPKFLHPHQAERFHVTSG